MGNYKLNYAFIVGCGHTGTTLLSAMLSIHKDIYCPMYETEIFFKKDSLKKIKELEKIAKDQNYKYLLEKTPRHLYKIEKINGLLKNVKFLSCIRNGYDTIFSLNKRYNDLEKSINRYIDDNLFLISMIENNNIKLVKYEELTSTTEKTLKEVCKFLNIKYNKNMLNFHNYKLIWKNKSQNSSLRTDQISKPVYISKHNLDKNMIEYLNNNEKFLKILKYFNYNIKE